jgi:hypothetical protein
MFAMRPQRRSTGLLGDPSHRIYSLFSTSARPASVNLTPVAQRDLPGTSGSSTWLQDHWMLGRSAPAHHSGFGLNEYLPSVTSPRASRLRSARRVACSPQSRNDADVAAIARTNLQSALGQAGEVGLNDGSPGGLRAPDGEYPSDRSAHVCAQTAGRKIDERMSR